MSALELTIEDGVATLLFNRPEAKNAINMEMSDQLDAAVLQIDRDRDIRVVILAGAGGGLQS